MSDGGLTAHGPGTFFRGIEGFLFSMTKKIRMFYAAFTKHN